MKWVTCHGAARATSGIRLKTTSAKLAGSQEIRDLIFTLSTGYPMERSGQKGLMLLRKPKRSNCYTKGKMKLLLVSLITLSLKH